MREKSGGGRCSCMASWSHVRDCRLLKINSSMRDTCEPSGARFIGRYCRSDIPETQRCQEEDNEKNWVFSSSVKSTLSNLYIFYYYFLFCLYVFLFR